MPENKAEEIIKALRCSGSPGGPESCDGCPYLFREQLPKELWGEHGGRYVDGCDTDRIVLEAADRLEALLAENERLKAQAPKWVSVEERLPEMFYKEYDDIDGTHYFWTSRPVLGVNRAGDVEVVWHSQEEDGRTHWENDPGNIYEITHWMPLPSTEGVTP